MYTYNNIPYYNRNMRGYVRNNNGDRFFGGGIILPLIAGGLIGSALTRPYVYSYPAPYPVPYPYPAPATPMPYPTTPMSYTSYPNNATYQTYSNTDYNVYY